MAKLTKAQLEERAAELEIDISSAKNNEERLNLIKEAEKAISESKEEEEVLGQEDAPKEEVLGETYGEDTPIGGSKDKEIIDGVDESYDKELVEEKPEEIGEKYTSMDKKDEAEIPSPIVIIKKARVDLDELLQFGELLLGGKSDLCESIFKAKCWLGKSLSLLGEENPYKTKKPIKSPKDIPATADVADATKSKHEFDLLNRIDKVVLMRELLGNVIDDVSKVPGTLLSSVQLIQFYVHTSEARFELGRELSLIREGKI